MKEQEDKKFQRAIIVSAILHLVLVGIFFFGFPSVFEKLPEEQDVMTFEILPTSELSNVLVPVVVVVVVVAKKLQLQLQLAHKKQKYRC